MQVRLGRVYKRPNSTLQCTNWVTVELDVYLKENTSFNNPTFVWQGDGLTIQKCNIAYEAKNGIYYFIKDVISISNNLVEIVCEKDVLATWKEVIGEHTTYIERSATGFDDMVRDTMITQRIDYADIDRVTTTMPDWQTNNQPICVVRTASSQGATSYFSASANGFFALLAPFMPKAVTNTVEEIFKDSWKATYSPFSYLLETYMLPCGKNYINSLPEQTPVMGFQRSPEPYTFPFAITALQGEETDMITINRPSRYFNDFRDFDENWTSFTLFIPGIGLINLPATCLQNELKIKCYYDFLTGDMNVNVFMAESSGSDYYSLGTWNGNIKSNFQFSAMNAQSTALLQGSAGFWSNVVRGNFAEGIQAGVEGVLNSNNPGSTSTDRASGQIFYHLSRPNIIASAVRYKAKHLGTGTVGRPKYENVKINTMSGYIKCVNPSVFIPAQIDDMRQINEYLRNGFYYE